jgi:hypothetical protein
LAGDPQPSHKTHSAPLRDSIQRTHAKVSPHDYTSRRRHESQHRHASHRGHASRNRRDFQRRASPHCPWQAIYRRHTKASSTATRK